MVKHMSSVHDARFGVLTISNAGGDAASCSPAGNRLLDAVSGEWSREDSCLRALPSGVDCFKPLSYRPTSPPINSKYCHLPSYFPY